MANIVYLIQFKRDLLPNKYIGSKSNCEIIDGKIIGNRGLYLGSSKDKLFLKAREECEYIIHVLGTFASYEECLKAEKTAHLANDVVASPEYFNKSIAMQSTYSYPNYGTFKHVGTGKIARLPLDHTSVLNKTWVGVTAGRVIPEAERKKRGRPGESNPFFGKHHTEETKKKAGTSIGNAHRGVPKSLEHREKLAEAARKRWQNERNKKCEADRQPTCI